MTDPTDTTGTTDTKATLPPAFVLARAMFRAQKLKGDAIAEDATFQEQKEQWLPQSRRIMKILNNQGYTLTRTEE